MFRHDVMNVFLYTSEDYLNRISGEDYWSHYGTNHQSQGELTAKQYTI